MTRDQVIKWLAFLVIAGQLGFGLAWYLKPEPEPQTWCPKRLYGFFLVGERLELDTFSTDGVLTCRMQKAERQPHETPEMRAAELPAEPKRKAKREPAAVKK